MTVQGTTTSRNIALGCTAQTGAAAVELLRNWMQDGFNSEAEHKELVEQTEAMIRALAKEDS